MNPVGTPFPPVGRRTEQVLAARAHPRSNVTPPLEEHLLRPPDDLEQSASVRVGVEPLGNGFDACQLLRHVLSELPQHQGEVTGTRL